MQTWDFDQGRAQVLALSGNRTNQRTDELDYRIREQVKTEDTFLTPASQSRGLSLSFVGTPALGPLLGSPPLIPLGCRGSWKGDAQKPGTCRVPSNAPPPPTPPPQGSSILLILRARVGRESWGAGICLEDPGGAGVCLEDPCEALSQTIHFTAGLFISQ